MKVKTSELTGTALDWAVAKCEGYIATFKPDGVVYAHPMSGEWHHNGNWSPSTKWVQGGPIIERENITIVRADNDYVLQPDGEYKPVADWFADCPGRFYGYSECTSYEGEHMSPTYMVDAEDGCHGPTPLVAAVRAYVRRKLGDEVDVPDELLGEQA